MKKMQKRFWSLLLCAALVLTLLPSVTLKAYAAGTIYTDQNGQTQTTPVNATSITTSTTTLTTGWYIVDSDVELTSTLTVSGDVKLILGDGHTLKVTGSMNNAGIDVPLGSSLTIYGQTVGNGTLISLANYMCGGNGGAGIGNGSQQSVGSITINGGIITAKGVHGAGIGGGQVAYVGTIIINGGTVTATGDSGGAGIGDGPNSDGAIVIINGGSVNASSIKGTPQNGVGKPVYLNTLTIEGSPANAAVTALTAGSAGNYGINNIFTNGSGTLYFYLPESTGSEIVSATVGGADYTAAFQRMSNMVHNTRTLSNDTMPPTASVSPSGSDAAMSGNLTVTFNEAMDTDTGVVALNGGIANLTSGIWSNGNTTYTVHYSGASNTAYTVDLTDFRDAAGNNLTVDSYTFTTQVSSDTIPPTVLSVSPSGSDIATSGNLIITFSEAMDTTVCTVSLDGGISSLTGGTWSNGNTVYTVPYAKLSYNKSYTVAISGFSDSVGNNLSADSTHSFKTKTVSYTDETGQSQTMPNSTIVMPVTASTNTLTNGWYITDSDLTLSSTLTVSGDDVKLILADGHTLKVTGLSDEAGVTVTKGKKLTIYEQAQATGKLDASGGSFDLGGAGIGAPGYDEGVNGCGTVIINGGIIVAKGSTYCSGIGAGQTRNDCIVTINGGVVTATGDPNNGAYGIGSSSSAIITINGGIVNATDHIDGTVTINGGSVKTSSFSSAPTNSSGATVYLNTLTVPGQANQPVTAASINGKLCKNTPDASNGVYGLHGVSTDSSGALYFYLPVSASSEIVSATVGNSAYRASYQRTSGTANNTRTLVSNDLVISMATIGGVTLPMAGDTPVTAIAETDQYTGTVTWSPSSSTFQFVTAYTATITLTPKSGYTLSGVARNYFTVPGATSVSNNADSGVITAVFPNTEAPPPYGISLNRTGIQILTGQTVGYGAVTPLSTTVSNTGSQATGNLTVALSGPNAGSFTLSKTTISSITTGGSDNFNVVPNGGLSAGTYTATVTVSGSSVTSQTFMVSFTVVNASTPGGGISSGGSGSGSGSSTPYQATVKGSGGSSSTLTITTNGSSATVAVGNAQTNLLTGGGKLAIDIPTVKGVTSNGVQLPASSLSAKAGGALIMGTGLGSIALPSNMLSTLSDIKDKTAQITVGEGNRTALPNDVKAEIGDRPVIQLTLSIDGRQVAWNNPNAPVTVTIPYRPTATELKNPDSIIIWYIDGNGKAVCVPSGSYDAVSGTVTFTTTHFSLYAVGFNNVSFSDVSSSDWYYDAVSFLSARKITTGTNNGTFSPDASLTRGQFLVMLMRAYGIAAEKNPSVNFVDAGNTYYTGYLVAAKRLGISSGVGNDLFAPQQQITRQEMFTLLYNALKATGNLPRSESGKSLSSFSDSGEIASWARDAVQLFAETGTISGSNGKLTPTSTTTRAEMAQVLYKLLKR